MNLMMRDIQQDPVVGFCRVCGRELYRSGELCERCSENKKEVIDYDR